MKTELRIERLSFGTVYKIMALGLAASFIPFSFLMGTLAYFGAGTVTWNGQALTGVSGLLASPFIGLFVSLSFTLVLGTMVSIGLWIVSKLRPIRISFHRVKDDAAV